MSIINSIPATQIEQWYHGNYTTEFDKWIILEKLEEFHGVAFYIGYFSDANISFEKVDKDTIRVEYTVNPYTMSSDDYKIDDLSDEVLKVDIPQKMEGYIIQRIKDLQNTLGCV